MPSTETTRNLPHGEDAASNTPFQPDPRLSALCIEHDDLDAVIGALLQSGLCDDLLVTRLKKRKLQIKDEIAGVMAPGQFFSTPVARAS